MNEEPLRGQHSGMAIKDMTLRELNELVARKLGWKECQCAPDVREAHKSYMPSKHEVSPYSTSIEAAWEIFDFIKMEYPNWQVSVWRVKEDWAATLGTTEEHYADYADTAPLAICKAFLKLP